MSGGGMRVIFLTITFDPEPGALRGLPLAKRLAERGYDIKVLTTFPQYPAGKIYPGYQVRPWTWETMDGIPVLRVPMYPSHDTSALRRIATYLSFAASAALIGVPLIGPADVVYLYEPPPTNGVASLLLKWFRRTPIVHHIADMWPETVIESGMLPSWPRRFVGAVLGRYCKFLYDQAAVMTVLSPGFKRLLIERGVPAEKIQVIYNWADESLFGPRERDAALANRLGLNGRFNVVYAGNMGPLQAMETVVEAAALLGDRPDVQVVIIGTGPREAQVKALAAARAVTNVRFIERLDYREMPQVNALADVLLVHLKDLPFLHSTIPSKTQVGMASARPLLMALHGDAADLVERAGAGLSCAPEDPAALAATIRRFADMPRAQLDAMGQRGRDYYLTNLSIDAGAEKMEEVFHIARHGGRARQRQPGTRNDTA